MQEQQQQQNVRSLVDASSLALYAMALKNGYKKILRTFPHSVKDYMASMDMLFQCDTQQWERAYIALLWISVTLMIPFDLVAIDESASSEDEVKSLRSNDDDLQVCLDLARKQSSRVWRFLRISCGTYLRDPGIVRDGAGRAVARLVVRKDMVQSGVSDAWMKWARNQLNSEDEFLVSGISSSLAFVFKFGQREKLVEWGGILAVDLINLSKKNGILIRKLCCKVLQRIAIVILPETLSASWKYSKNVGSSTGNAEIEQDLDISEDEGETIQNIVEFLVSALKDKDTVVRWSAAKGIGRVTAKLTKEQALDIASSISESFVESESDSSWHGSCLAIAELARRGLLLPSQIEPILGAIYKALTYDVRRGKYSIGTHVRDAACYVCWAFARAYSPSILKPHLHDITSNLLVVSLLDREVNCRRAASAAFQEHVGRQGHENFPNGIAVISIADFVSLGNRKRAYKEFPKNILLFAPEYKEKIMESLIDTKITHWDAEIRMLASESIGSIIPFFGLEFVLNNIIADKLLLNALGSLDAFTRHGCIMSLAEVILALGIGILGMDKCQSVLQEIEGNLFSRMEKGKMFRGAGGDMAREACCRLIECYSMSGYRIDVARRDQLKSILQDCMIHSSSEVRNAACKGLKELLRNILQNRGDQGEALTSFMVDTFRQYLKEAVGNPIPSVRRGYALGVGSFSVMLGALPASTNAELMGELLHSSETILRDDKDPENRSLILESLSEFAVCIGDTMDGAVMKIMALACQSCNNDYAVDDRGDVGSWVRSASIKTLGKAIPILMTMEMDVTVALCAILRQLAEKMDSVRFIAGSVIEHLVKDESDALSQYSWGETMVECVLTKRMVNDEESDENEKEFDVDWKSRKIVYSLLKDMLRIDKFRESIIHGLCISVGYLTESISSEAERTLLDWIGEDSNGGGERAAFVFECLTDYLCINSKVDRIAVPAMKTIVFLFEVGVDCGKPVKVRLLKSLAEEATQTTNTVKLVLSAKILLRLHHEFDEELKQLWMTMMDYLLRHQYPTVRRDVAEQTYIWTLENDFEQFMDYLLSIAWDSDDALRQRDRISDFLLHPR